MFKIAALLVGASCLLPILSAHAGGAQANPAPPTAAPMSCPALFQHRFARLQDEQPQDLCQYSGKVILVVNTASYCGFTKQYEGLERIYAKYKARGFVVLGFPSNDFGQQEPGNSKEIADLCFNTFGVQFPMFAKSSVKGKQANALHAQLAQLTGQEPKWNFTKYLIGRDGKVISYYPSKVTPEDAVILGAIEKAL